jgi:hypothetical protein
MISSRLAAGNESNALITAGGSASDDLQIVSAALSRPLPRVIKRSNSSDVRNNSCPMLRMSH